MWTAILFYTGSTPFHLSSQQCTKVPVSSHHCQNSFSASVMVAVLMGIKWYLFLFLICISLMISDVEHVFICLFTIGISAMDYCLFKLFAQFLVRLFDFLFCSSLYILDINTLSHMWFISIFYHYLSCLLLYCLYF